jgi:hypothetical protein
LEFELLCQRGSYAVGYLSAQSTRHDRSRQLLRGGEAGNLGSSGSIWWLLIFGYELVGLVCLVVDLFGIGEPDADCAVPPFGRCDCRGQRMHVARYCAHPVRDGRELQRLRLLSFLRRLVGVELDLLGFGDADADGSLYPQ